MDVMKRRSSADESIRQTVEARLQTYARFGVDLGLARIEKLLADLGPQQVVPIIHVAGTNGKGSVCAYLSAVLTAAGYRTGRYTSPHLVDWTERICIDQMPISWANLQESLAAVEQAIDPDSPTPTQFEVFTAAAWQYFAAQQVEVAVVEVGLGGRLDATNVCKQPLATVIVSIGRDHWQRLGDTLAAIATEKAGIFKPGVQAIAGPLPAEAQAVVSARAAELQAPLTWVSPAEKVAGAPRESMLQYDGIQYPQTLLGDHQRVNSACAIATLQVLRAKGWRISTEAITRGMAQVRWPGRLQRSQWQGHPLLIDGAHNVEAARSLRTYLDQACPDQPITWLMGMLQTKDHQGVFTALLRDGDRLHLVPVPGHLSAEPAVLGAIAQQTCTLALTYTHPDLAAGLTAATQLANSAGPVVLCGSLYLIGHFYEYYEP
ncbi:MAG: folylpolyglutamate synthase/dihydrofolate synthase family protein [Phormidesmis sp.]